MPDLDNTTNGGQTHPKLTPAELAKLESLARTDPKLAAWLREYTAAAMGQALPEAAPGDPETQPATWAAIKNLIGEVSWLWDGWIANGFLNILGGESGAGKSTLMLRICEPVLMPGVKFPDEAPYTGELGRVLWVECEAAEALNIQRAERWGIPLDAIITPFSDPFIQVNLDDPNHQAAITAAANRPDVKIIVIDSLRGAHRGNENDSVVFSMGLYLAGLARDTNKPVIASHHLRKKSIFDGELTQERLRGSSAIVQTARLIMGLDIPNPEQPETKRLSILKSNLAAKPKPIGVEINEDGITFVAAPMTPITKSPKEKAVGLLLELLANDQERPSTEIYSAFEGAGISQATMNRAKTDLHIETFSRHGIWFWRFPRQSGQGAMAYETNN